MDTQPTQTPIEKPKIGCVRHHCLLAADIASVFKQLRVATAVISVLSAALKTGLFSGLQRVNRRLNKTHLKRCADTLLSQTCQVLTGLLAH